MNSKNLKIENSYCENIDELLKSSDFRRIFKIVLDTNKKFNSGYYLSILDKINKNEIIDKKEKSDFIDLLNDSDFIDLLNDSDFEYTGKNIINKIKGFSLEEAKNFLLYYPAENIILELKDKTSKNLIEILGGTKVEKGFYLIKNEIFGVYKDITTNKFCIKREKEEDMIKNEDFIFDEIFDLDEINGEIFYCAIIDEKVGYIKLGEETKFNEKIIFDEIGDLEEINGKLYYKAKIDNKDGYIIFGCEESYLDSVKFDEIGDLEENNGEFFYYAKVGNKCGYIKLGEETYSLDKIIFDKIFNIGGNIMTYNNGLLRVNGDLFNIVRKNKKEGVIKIGDEKEWQDYIIFDRIDYQCNPFEKNANFFSFSGKVGKFEGEIDYKNKTFTYKKWMGFKKNTISFEDIRNGKLK